MAPSEWGGLLLTLLQASFAILLCFPLGVLLALVAGTVVPASVTAAAAGQGCGQRRRS